MIGGENHQAKISLKFRFELSVEFTNAVEIPAGPLAHPSSDITGQLRVATTSVYRQLASKQRFLLKNGIT